VASCQFDGEDCSECNNITNNPGKVNDGICDGGNHNSLVCSDDGGDCTACNVAVNDITKVEDGVCDGGYYNTFMRNFDGLDCNQFNSTFPNCTVEIPS